MARHGTGEPENAWNQGGRDSEDPRKADFRSSDDPITTGAFMAPVADQAGWPAPPDQIDQQFQAGPSTGEWAVPPQQPDMLGRPATEPMSARDAFGDPVSAFGGGPSGAGSSFFGDPGPGSGDRGPRPDSFFGDPGPGQDSFFGDPGPGPDSGFGDRAYGGSAFGDAGRAAPGFGEQAPGGRGPADPAFGGQGDDAFGGPGHGETAVFGDRVFGDPAFGDPVPGGAPYGGQGFDDAGGPATGPHPVTSSPTDRLVATGPPRQPVAAWEDAAEPNETAFLSGGEWSENADWEDEREDRSSRGRRGRRRPAAEARESGQGGRGKVALLSVAAVAIVLGGTVVGVRMVSSSGEASKAGAGTTSQSASPVSETSEATEPDPSAEESDPAAEETAEEPTEEPTDQPSETKAAVRPRPSASTAPERGPRRTTTPRPSDRPTRSAVPEDPEPSEEPTPTAEPSDMREANNTGQPGVPDPVTSSTSGTGSGSQSSSTSSGGAAVNVRFDVVRQRLAGYTAEVQVVNDSTRSLNDWTLSIPVDGLVSAVRGAQWVQDGGLLVLQPRTTLAAGESVEVTFTATGSGDAPVSCGLVGGECTVG